MSTVRVLNLYAGIGGNRAGWPTGIEVVAVEQDPEIAAAYAALWPDDEVVVGDAHEYLLDTITEPFDLRWSSPCVTHSKLNRFQAGKGNYRYPDLGQLYGEIILLREFLPEGSAWVVENVIPYYVPLIPPTTMLDRHYIWSNRPLPYVGLDMVGRKRIARDRKSPKGNRTLSRMLIAETSDWEDEYGIRLPACADRWGRDKRRKVMRNCVDPKLGKSVWDAIFTADRGEQDTLLGVEHV